MTSVLTLSLFIIPSILFAEGYGLPNVPELKERLSKKGIDIQLAYIGEFWANTDGGIKRDQTYLANLDLSLSLETGSLGLWDNGIFFIYMIDNHGGEKLSGEIVGDLQAASNIEAPRTTRLFELWYEHQWEDLALLIGLHDLNSEFSVTEYGSLFINSSFGISPDISGSARPSIFPLAAFGVRSNWDITEQSSIRLGIYDGDPGDPEINEHIPRSILDSEGGAFLIAEFVHHVEESLWGHPLTVKIGTWQNTGEFDDLRDTDAIGNAIKRKNHRGIYALTDSLLHQFGNGGELGHFLQLGFSHDHISEVEKYLGSGLHCKGCLFDREHDEIGIAVAHAIISDELNDTSREEAETTLELTYRAHICENFAIQPDFQIIWNPGAASGVNTAYVTGLRFELLL